MKSEVDKLEGHVIVVGFGRIGAMLAKELESGGAKFVVLEQSEDRAREVRDLGHLCLVGDATDESSLRDAGIARACISGRKQSSSFKSLSMAQVHTYRWVFTGLLRYLGFARSRPRHGTRHAEVVMSASCLRSTRNVHAANRPVKVHQNVVS